MAPSIPLSSSIFWNSIYLAAHTSKLLHTSPSPLQRYLFLDNTITLLHLSHHTIIHYPSFPHFIMLKLHHFCYPKHISLSFFISHTKSPFLESNITHNTNNLMYLLYLTFILSISHFHMFYKHIPHKIPIILLIYL